MAWLHEAIVRYGSSFLESRLKSIRPVADAVDDDGVEHAAVELQGAGRSAISLEVDERLERFPRLSDRRKL